MGWFEVRVRQSKILLRKNFIIYKRNIQATTVQILVPALFVFFVWVLQFPLRARLDSQPEVQYIDTFRPENLAPLPRCLLQDGQKSCLTLAYISDHPNGTQIIKEVQQAHGIPDSEVRQFNSIIELDDYLTANPNTTLASVTFNLTMATVLLPDNTTVTIPQHRFNIQYNYTNQYDGLGNPVRKYLYLVTPLQMEIESRLAKYATGRQDLTIDLQISQFTHKAVGHFDSVGQNGPSFFFAALMFNVVIQLGQIVNEKELKLREGMNQMGLRDSVYWLTWFVTNSIVNTISVMVLIITGCIFQFEFFLLNDFGLYFFLFFLFGISMVPVVFLLSVFINESATATSIGFITFLIGTIVQGFATTAFSSTFYALVRVIFSLLPFAVLGKGITDLAAASDAQGLSGMRWSDRATNDWFSLETGYKWFIFDFFFYFILAVYFDNIVPSPYGTKKSALFFLTPSYWTGKTKRPNQPQQAWQENQKKSENGVEMEQVDEDITEERRNVLNDTLPATTAVKISHLRKVFSISGGCCRPGKKFVGVKDTCLAIDSSTLFCLLGHNGAGKTTTINMMTGMYAATSGDATVYGHSILDGMDEIRRIMGVCPQHDILWDLLTGREHLEIFAGFKGIPADKIEAECTERLKDVELTYVEHLPSKNYSGGMKRRLSVAIALTADPKIVYLDEPTTGMDPVSRRQVWNLIEKVKKGRVIVLTTHSMEEADVLGDRIGIMKQGSLVVLGTSLRLKNKFGAGYRITVVTESDDTTGPVIGFVKNILGIDPTSNSLGILDFDIPRQMIGELPRFMEQLEAHQHELHIRDLQVAMTTLEEVFMRIAGDH